MKKIAIIALSASLFMGCNNETKTSTTEHTGADTPLNLDPAPTADTSSTAAMPADEATTNFLLKAAEGGLAEVAASKYAQTRTKNSRVKMFADMMVNDHSGANQKVKDFASKLRIDIPGTPSAEHGKKLEENTKKEGSAFDKSYMGMMVDDHKKTISLFKESAATVGNAEVKEFINITLPKLQVHLDSAQAIQKSL